MNASEEPAQSSTSEREARLERLAGLADAARELAHELKNQLGVAIGSAELLLDTLADAEQREDLRRSLGALERIQTTVTFCQRLLRGAFQVERFDATRLLEEVRSAVDPLLVRRGRQLRVAWSQDVVPVRGDQHELASFLTAMLFSGSCGDLDLRLGRAPDGRARLLVLGEVLTRGESWSLPREMLALRAMGCRVESQGDGLLLDLPAG